MLTYIGTWFPMVVIAIGNGILRDKFYGRRMIELRAHQLSTLLGIVLLGIYMVFVIHFWPPASGDRAIRAGLLWVALTVAFELGFGRYVAGYSWGRLVKDYNAFEGRVWPAILVWVACAPYLFYRLLS